MTEIKPKYGIKGAMARTALQPEAEGMAMFFIGKEACNRDDDPLKYDDVIVFTPSQFAQEIEEQREEAAREAFKHAIDYFYEGEPDDFIYEEYVRVALEEFKDHWQSRKGTPESSPSQKQKNEGK